MAADIGLILTADFSAYDFYYLLHTGKSWIAFTKYGTNLSARLGGAEFTIDNIAVFTIFNGQLWHQRDTDTV